MTPYMKAHYKYDSLHVDTLSLPAPRTSLYICTRCKPLYICTLCSSLYICTLCKPLYIHTLRSSLYVGTASTSKYDYICAENIQMHVSDICHICEHIVRYVAIRDIVRYTLKNVRFTYQIHVIHVSTSLGMLLLEILLDTC